MRKSDIVYKRKTIKLLKIINCEDEIQNILPLNSAKQINRYLNENEKIKNAYKEYLKKKIMEIYKI